MPSENDAPRYLFHDRGSFFAHVVPASKWECLSSFRFSIRTGSPAN